MHIRPICLIVAPHLIQVERTGRDQRLPGVVHAEDAREYLMERPDIGAEQIAVKTSTRDDLKEVDDAGGLLTRDCQIRFIITKQALQEGWDCAFAYVLAILTRPSSTSALTQLVGRILRQPLRAQDRRPLAGRELRVLLSAPKRRAPARSAARIQSRRARRPSAQAGR